MRETAKGGQLEPWRGDGVRAGNPCTVPPERSGGGTPLVKCLLLTFCKYCKLKFNL